MEHLDTLVVGAGVVGLAVARALALQGREVVVVEAAAAIGQGVSARSSEVVHAGLYYAPGSLKARLCVRGRSLLYDYAQARGLPHRRCGKWIVATEDSQRAALERILASGAANGVPLQWVDGPDLRAREPELAGVAALWSPLTGIVDSHALMQALRADLEAAGGQVVLHTALHSAVVRPGQGVVTVRLRDAQGDSEFGVSRLVNAAGLQACEVVARTEGLAAEHRPRARFAKGSYFALNHPVPFASLVYPAPTDAWLGVHLTLDLSGQARFGPDLEWLPEGLGPADIDYAVDPRRAAHFEQAIRRYWPGLPEQALQPAYSGVRPKIHGPDERAPDFRVDGPEQHGVPGLVNLLGIESPGLTASLALAELVVERLQA